MGQYPSDAVIATSRYSVGSLSTSALTASAADKPSPTMTTFFMAPGCLKREKQCERGERRCSTRSCEKIHMLATPARPPRLLT